jgi:hypothetical protein
VSVTASPLWRLRLGSELPRLVLLSAATAGLLACVRYTIAPPRPLTARAVLPAMPARDPAAEGFAQLFARRYLTWNANDPEAHQQGLAPFVGSSMETDAGLQPPPAGEEQVQWTAIVQERIAAPGAPRLFTVAAQTDTAGLLYLALGVTRAADGALQLDGYPALVGAPASAPAIASAQGPEATDPALRVVVERALRNYLANAGGELAADLTSAARVSPPAWPLSLETLQRLDWAPSGGPPPVTGPPGGASGSRTAGIAAVQALVQAQDGRGARYTLAYQLDVAQVAGRWEVAAIEMNPDT